MLEFGPIYQLTGAIIGSTLTAGDEIGADRILTAGTRFAVLRVYASLPSSPELEPIGANAKFYKIRIMGSPAEAQEYLVMADLLERDSKPVQSSPDARFADGSVSPSFPHSVE